MSPAICGRFTAALVNSFLRHHMPSRQVGLLLVFVFGTLLVVIVLAFDLSLRDRRKDGAQSKHLDEFNTFLSAFWVMSAVFSASWPWEWRAWSVASWAGWPCSNLTRL